MHISGSHMQYIYGHIPLTLTKTQHVLCSQGPSILIFYLIVLYREIFIAYWPPFLYVYSLQNQPLFISRQEKGMCTLEFCYTIYGWFWDMKRDIELKIYIMVAVHLSSETDVLCVSQGSSKYRS